ERRGLLQSLADASHRQSRDALLLKEIRTAAEVHHYGGKPHGGGGGGSRGVGLQEFRWHPVPDPVQIEDGRAANEYVHHRCEFRPASSGGDLRSSARNQGARE